MISYFIQVLSRTCHETWSKQASFEARQIHFGAAKLRRIKAVWSLGLRVWGAFFGPVSFAATCCQPPKTSPKLQLLGLESWSIWALKIIKRGNWKIHHGEMQQQTKAALSLGIPMGIAHVQHVPIFGSQDPRGCRRMEAVGDPRASGCTTGLDMVVSHVVIPQVLAIAKTKHRSMGQHRWANESRHWIAHWFDGECDDVWIGLNMS